MKTLEYMLNEYKFETFGGRDKSRIMSFASLDQLERNGFKLNNESIEWVPQEWTEENIKSQLKSDLEFAFEKALDKRGLSAGEMFYVIKMWNDILEVDIPLQYAQYGLPYLKATALHHGFHNPIGDDVGDEFEYSAEADS